MGITETCHFSNRSLPAFRNACSFLVILAAVIFCIPSVSPAASGQTIGHSIKDRYLDASARFHTLMGDKDASLNDWLWNAQNFQIAYISDPGSPFALNCLFMLGRTYREMFNRFHNPKDLNNALTFFNDTARLFPKKDLAGDSLMAVADITLNNFHDPQKAAEILKRIVTDFADGEIHRQALERLDELSRKYKLKLTENRVVRPRPERLTYVLPVKYWSSNDYTRVVINTSGPVKYLEKLLGKSTGKPRRLMIDFFNSYVEPRFRAPVPIKEGLLKRIHTSQYTADTVRVDLDMESISSYSIFSLVDPFRVIVDVRGRLRSKPVVASVPNIKPAKVPVRKTAYPTPKGHSLATKNPSAVNHKSVNETAITPRAENPPATPRIPFIPSSGKPLSLAQQLGLRVKTIVIDPGHGGKDPGAMANGLKEKNIVLKVAKKLALILRKKLDCRVILTRSTDVFIPLEERTAIANKNDADLFVSLHVNADPDAEASGFETYYLNLTSNPEAMRVAAYENETSTHQISEMKNILSSILKNSKIQESSRLAEQVQEALIHGLRKDFTGIKDMKVRKAPFYVLMGAEMPAILVEMSFITNKHDARHLKSNRFLTNIADDISKGIQSYISTNTAGILPAFSRN